jgi:serine/threonine-protein kinase
VHLVNALRNLGIFYDAERRWKESEATWRDARTMARRTVGDQSLEVALATQRIGSSLLQQGRDSEAETELRVAVAAFARLMPASSPVRIRAQLDLGDVYRAERRYSSAESLLVTGYRMLGTRTAYSRAQRRFAQEALVRLYDAWGRPDDAAKFRKELGTEPQDSASR